MRRIVLLGGFLAALACAADVAVAAEILLGRDTNVRIVEEGSFGK